MSKKSNNKSGMSMKTKWIITGILCVLAVLTVVVVAADGCFDFKPGSVQSNDKAVAKAPRPTPTRIPQRPAERTPFSLRPATAAQRIPTAASRLKTGRA